jgi:hypothetical protein
MIMKNVIGIKIGRLTILERAGKNKHNLQLLLCLCNCGRKTIVTYANLFRTDNKGTKSCGCYAREQSASKQIWEVEFRRYARSNATRRTLDFPLTLEEFKKLCSSNCFYCGTPPQIKTHVGATVRSSIDRLDSSVGYLFNNCVAFCVTCQFMKGSLSHISFITQIKLINDKLSGN